MTDAVDAFWQLGRSGFVLLTTFRRSGVGVATVVWVAREGDRLVVTTGAESSKVKRLRRDPRVLLSPCGRLGRVPMGAAVVAGEGEVLGPDGDHPGAVAALRGKYGLQYRAVLGIEGAAARRRGRQAERVILALRPAG